MPENLTHTIAVLGGTGNLGPGLAARWAAAGYQVVIGSRKEEKARRVAAELNQRMGGHAVRGMANPQAAQAADISVLTVKYTAHQAVLEALKDCLQNKILVDAIARVDYRDPKPPPAPSAARMAQQRLGPQAKVVAAFQTVPAQALMKNLGAQLELDVLVCADQIEAARAAMRLAEAAGMRAFYAGKLDNAIVLEGLAAMMIGMNKHYASRKGSIRIAGIEE